MSESPYAQYGQQAGYGSNPPYAAPGPGRPVAAAGQGYHPQASTAPPPSNIGWAVAALLFFWPISFSAFTHSSNVFPMWSTGDHQGAQYASDRAKQLGKIALIVWAVLIVGFFVVYGVLIAVILNSIPQY